MSDTSTIICPHCRRPISLDEAITHHLMSQFQEKFEKEALAKAQKEAKIKFDLELRNLTEELVEEKKRNQELITQITELNRLLRYLKRKDEERELETEKRLSNDRDQIQLEERKKAEEEQRLRILEKDKQLQNALKEAQDLKRKLELNSQQLQGEVLEIDFENELRRKFPQDTIEPIGKGVLGADIRQTVKSPLGLPCGTILWESKRTKLWSNDWLEKLKNDVLSDKANLPALVSEVVPEEAKHGIGNKNGVWITTPKLALVLAELLRSRLLDVAKQKKIAQNKQTKSEQLYDYINSDDFANQIKAMMEAYGTMLQQIQDERAVFERIWKKREMQILKLRSGVAGVSGSIEEIAGKTLPGIKNLELLGK